MLFKFQTKLNNSQANTAADADEKPVLVSTHLYTPSQVLHSLVSLEWTNNDTGRRVRCPGAIGSAIELKPNAVRDDRLVQL